MTAKIIPMRQPPANGPLIDFGPLVRMLAFEDEAWGPALTQQHQEWRIGRLLDTRAGRICFCNGACRTGPCPSETSPFARFGGAWPEDPMP